MDLKGIRQVVHINLLQMSFNPELWEPKRRQKPEKNVPRRLAKPQNANGNSHDEFNIGPCPLVCPENSEARLEREPLVDHRLDTPDIAQLPADTPISDRNEPCYHPQHAPF